ncbi:MAG: hypothetical protein ACLRQF_06590 [Thomasclavelia ramosa]
MLYDGVASRWNLSLPLFAEHGFVWYIAGLLISFIELVLVLLF